MTTLNNTRAEAVLQQRIYDNNYKDGQEYARQLPGLGTDTLAAEAVAHSLMQYLLSPKTHQRQATQGFIDGYKSISPMTTYNLNIPLTEEFTRAYQKACKEFGDLSIEQFVKDAIAYYIATPCDPIAEGAKWDPSL